MLLASDVYELRRRVLVHIGVEEIPSAQYATPFLLPKELTGFVERLSWFFKWLKSGSAA